VDVNQLDASYLHAADQDAAQERLHALGCTDGLPVIVPTEARVAAMIAAFPGTADDVLGIVEPRKGVATVASVATNAVMAGCRPEHFRVVCAMVRGVCDPAFNLSVVQGTTNNAAPLTIVSGGPADIASGAGALGPGHRANATIGRALRLVLWNAGGGHPGEADMATLGQPAKFTFVVGEASSTLGSLATTPAVTVIGVEGPSQIMFVPVGDSTSADAERLLEMLARTLLAPGSLAGMGYRGSGAMLLCPLHADVLVAAGFDRAAIQHAIFERSVVRASEIRRLHGFVRGAPDIADDALVHGLSSPAHLTVAVAGGAGTYSVVLPGLAAGVGTAVTVPLRALTQRPAR
jgi:hypothetical protein